MRARVQAPVSILEVLRAAPRMIDQKPVSILEVLRAAPRMIDQKSYPRLNSSSC